jgi:hypothetical protein
MKSRGFVAALALAGCCVAASGGAAVAGDPLSYDDPGMHFKAPDGWTRLEVPPDDPNSSDKRTVAAFAYHAGRSDQRTIVITIEPYDGSLDSYERSHESDMRSGSDSAFIEEHTKTALANGMPAYFFRARTGDPSSNHDVERQEYLVIDTQRGIDVALISAVGEVGTQDAKDALASLYVVVYPERRRQ